MKRPGLIYDSLKALRADVAEERRLAVKEARFEHSFIRSRGTWITTTDKYATQCGPYPRAECPEWDGTWSEVCRAIDLVEAECPQVDAVWISGGYDGAESLQAFEDDYYTPWASEWDVCVWSRPAGRNAAAQAAEESA